MNRVDNKCQSHYCRNLAFAECLNHNINVCAWILNKLTNTVENILIHTPNSKTHPILVPKSIKKEYGAFRKLILKANDNGYFMMMLPKLLDEIQSIEFVHQVYYDQIMEKIDQALKDIEEEKIGLERKLDINNFCARIALMRKKLDHSDSLIKENESTIEMMRKWNLQNVTIPRNYEVSALEDQIFQLRTKLWELEQEDSLDDELYNSDVETRNCWQRVLQANYGPPHRNYKAIEILGDAMEIIMSNPDMSSNKGLYAGIMFELKAEALQKADIKVHEILSFYTKDIGMYKDREVIFRYCHIEDFENEKIKQLYMDKFKNLVIEEA